MNIQRIKENGRKVLYGGLAGLAMLAMTGCDETPTITQNNLSVSASQYNFAIAKDVSISPYSA